MSGGRRIGAVLTGDIVRSSALSSGDLSRLIEAISEAVDAVKGWEPSIVIGAPEFFRGDSWQVLVGRPEMALRAALRIRAGAVASGVADTRIAIAIGNIAPFDAEHISRSSSEAFVASGRLADAMGKRRLALALPAVFGPLGTWVSLGVELCGALADEWSARQAEVIAAVLDPAADGQEAIAERFGMTVQNVSKLLARARWHPVEAVLGAFERSDWLQSSGETLWSEI